jgi:hypothetical protein
VGPQGGEEGTGPAALVVPDYSGVGPDAPGASAGADRTVADLFALRRQTTRLPNSSMSPTWMRADGQSDLLAAVSDSSGLLINEADAESAAGSVLN